MQNLPVYALLGWVKITYAASATISGFLPRLDNESAESLSIACSAAVAIKVLGQSALTAIPYKLELIFTRSLNSFDIPRTHMLMIILEAVYAA